MRGKSLIMRINLILNWENPKEMFGIHFIKEVCNHLWLKLRVIIYFMIPCESYSSYNNNSDLESAKHAHKPVITIDSSRDWIYT